ncbi:MAG: transcriptional repressor LexA [bacterium]
MKKHTLNARETETLKQIRNWLMAKGYSPSVRDLTAALGYKSPRSISVLLEQLIEKGSVKRDKKGNIQLINNFDGDESRVSTIDIPLVGDVACGSPVFAEENIIDTIPVDLRLAKAPYRYFFLAAKGDSMNLKGINEGDLLLIRQQNTAKEGDIVVALINDEATVKEFHRAKGVILLKPHSKNVKHRPIIVTSDFIIQGIVTSVIPS